MSENKSSSRFNYLPVVFSIILCGGIYIGTRLQNTSGEESSIFSLSPAHFNKVNDIITYIEQEYVDTINREQLTDRSVEKLLQSLDPHSSYIPASELNAANEPLEGNFEGIGVEFNIINDTIVVIAPISGGPSEDRKSTRLNSSHIPLSRMPSSA